MVIRAATSDYSSLQMKLQKRLTSHFTTLVAFTWAKLMTDAAGMASLGLCRQSQRRRAGRDEPEPRSIP